jgi:hypothetical protein
MCTFEQAAKKPRSGCSLRSTWQKIGFNSRELADIILLVARHKMAFEAEWDEHFRD